MGGPSGATAFGGVGRMERDWLPCWASLTFMSERCAGVAGWDEAGMRGRLSRGRGGLSL